jgi:hypothetical protein
MSEVNKNRKYTKSEKTPVVKKTTTQEKTELNSKVTTIVNIIKQKHL